MDKPSAYVPRRYHDQQVTALTDRCVQAEEALANLLRMIDPTILQRHRHDWSLAVQELLA